MERCDTQVEVWGPENQKAERRAHVLATARALLDEGGADLDMISLNELARRAGMAKSNVYRYFETREAVLLALLWEEWVAWYEHMAKTYRRSAGGRSALDALVRHLARTLGARPLLCALTTALPSVLERNLSEEAIREIKTQSLASVVTGHTSEPWRRDPHGSRHRLNLFDRIARRKQWFHPEAVWICATCRSCRCR